MTEVVVNGKVLKINDDLEKGEMELDLLDHDSLNDTIDLSDAVVQATNSLEDTMNDIGIIDYE